MKVTNIIDDTTKSDVVFYELLRNGIRSEAVYNNQMIRVVLELDQPKKDYVDMFYRMFWEDNYLNLDPKNRSAIHYLSESDKYIFDMRITVGEALDFIWDATPPLLRDQIPDNTKTIDQIIGLLKTFLMEEDPQKITFEGIFRKYSKFDQYQKGYSFQTKLDRLRLIRDKVPTGAVTNIIYATTSISDIINGNRTRAVYLIHCNNTSEIQEVVKIVMGLDDYQILDVLKSMSGFYLLLSATSNTLKDIVKRSYSPFLS